MADTAIHETHVMQLRTRMRDAAKIRLQVDPFCPLGRITAAHAHMKTSQHFGKILITHTPAPSGSAAA